MEQKNPIDIIYGDYYIDLDYYTWYFNGWTSKTTRLDGEGTIETPYLIGNVTD